MVPMFLEKGIEAPSNAGYYGKNPERWGDLNGAYTAEFKW